MKGPLCLWLARRAAALPHFQAACMAPGGMGIQGTPAAAAPNPVLAPLNPSEMVHSRRPSLGRFPFPNFLTLAEAARSTRWLNGQRLAVRCRLSHARHSSSIIPNHLPHTEHPSYCPTLPYCTLHRMTPIQAVVRYKQPAEQQPSQPDGGQEAAPSRQSWPASLGGGWSAKNSVAAASWGR